MDPEIAATTPTWIRSSKSSPPSSHPAGAGQGEATVGERMRPGRDIEPKNADKTRYEPLSDNGAAGLAVIAANRTALNSTTTSNLIE
ncbi:hypothetical protein CORC01_04221 [Colletotrichum orchidophilum]|uniref:Uncharacterized protein n=1 Tax=Colletotrichum orchidophilum TaxID=1209926 RepID=A0A1G4BGG0_9PEZI|nr:uncharacterized protein CORC01_04221 [Colletotrichum orchidophilum]OHF00471.1 hypothetical protein CORC01_04221 [Colletotrichum orchidophilum]